MNEKRLHRCCFTGHRPNKLLSSELHVRDCLDNEILSTIDEGYSTFITGMACGVDIWAAELIIDKRYRDIPVRLICAIPFPGFEMRWSQQWQDRYHSVLVNADLIRFISPQYSPSCFQIRNQWMIDRSAKLIAVYDGIPGGTRNTIDYARRVGVEVKIIRTH